MSDIRIVNCHIHLFTNRHVPAHYPHPALAALRGAPWAIRAIAGAARIAGQDRAAETLDRLYRFQQESEHDTQAAILNRVIRQYPARTRFVVLPLDMTRSEHGRVEADLPEQHDELAALVREARHRDRLIPFAAIDPRREDAAAEVERCVGLGFRGLKLYPRLGFPPDHPTLTERIYPMLQERGLPVMSHCSRGGAKGRGLSNETADAFSAPRAYRDVLKRFPTLRICLAHFGGQVDWRAYVDDGVDPDDPDPGARNWMLAIREMIEGETYPNLWTDISYTLFQFESFIPFLALFLQDARLSERVLFGSDYYMTRQEALSERAVCFRLRRALGEDMFRRIAERNPGVWLGEPVEPAGTLDRRGAIG